MADHTGGGLLDRADINTFVQGFVTRGPIADLIGDAVIDLSDIKMYVVALVAGC